MSDFKIDNALISLLDESPIYITILSHLVKVNTPFIHTMAVGYNPQKQLCLFYNEKILNQIPELQESVTLLIHEAMHIYLDHLNRYKKTGNKKKDNIIDLACELAIDQHIKRPFPKITPATLPEMFNLPKDKDVDVDFYIQALTKKQKEEEEKQNQQGNGEGENKEGEGSQHLWNLILDPKTGETSEAKDVGVDTQQDVAQIIEHVNEQIKRMNHHQYGTLPAWILNELKRIEKLKNRYNWKYEFRLAKQTILTTTRKLSYKKVNRRGYKLPYVTPGKIKERRPDVLVIRDTSMSMYDAPAQKELYNEIACFAKHTQVTIMDCDTEIKQEFRLKSVNDLLKYKGGGGTSFVPALKRAMELKPNLIIYMTDTEGDFPKKEEVYSIAHKIIWVTFEEDASHISVPYGKHINILPGL